jgi:hypothetical protein
MQLTLGGQFAAKRGGHIVRNLQQDKTALQLGQMQKISGILIANFTA